MTKGIGILLLVISFALGIAAYSQDTSPGYGEYSAARAMENTISQIGYASLAGFFFTIGTILTAIGANAETQQGQSAETLALLKKIAEHHGITDNPKKGEGEQEKDTEPPADDIRPSPYAS